MTELRNAFIRHLTLLRRSPKTHKAYIGAVRDLARYHHLSPDELTDEQIQDYFAHLIGERKAAWSTCNIQFNGIKAFYKGVLDRDINAVIPPGHGKSNSLTY